MNLGTVSEDVEAHDVNLATRITEEGAESMGDPEKRPLAGQAIWPPIRERDDQEQVLRVRRNMSLPQVLEVMVVGDGGSRTRRCPDSAPSTEPEVEVWTSRCRESLILSETDLLLVASVDFEGDPLKIGKSAVRPRL